MTSFGALPEIPLEGGSLVIADLHLDVASDDARESAFERWCDGLRDVPRLVILGDLFDSWIGPAQMEIESARRVLDALRRLSVRGTELDVLKGNRDFLLDAKFEERTGAAVHAGGIVATCGDGPRVLLIHGDELCTLDRGYQRLRGVLRSGPVTWTAPKLPRAIALAIARRLRGASTRAVYAKPAAEKEQQESEVRRLASAAHCDVVVCGHAHLFRDVRLEKGPRWIVLDAFGGDRDVLRCAARGELEPTASASLARPPRP